GQSVSINPQFIQNYNQDSTGFTAFASYPIKRFSFLRVGLTYGLTRTDITAFNDASKLLFQSIQYRSFVGPSGGNVNTITNVVEWKKFRPINKKRNVLGFHAQAAYITGYGGKEIPPF